jgi:hypothetical protein
MSCIVLFFTLSLQHQVITNKNLFKNANYYHCITQNYFGKNASWSAAIVNCSFFEHALHYLPF